MSGELTAVSSARPAARHQVTDIKGLNGSQKAAILVRMILSKGGTMDLGSLAPHAQMRLATDYASMVRVNRATLDAVVDEFAASLHTGGLDFPEKPDEVLEHMEGMLAPEMSGQLRDRFGLGTETDPWRAIVEMDAADLSGTLAQESASVAALILSKLKPEKVSDVLDCLDPDQARAMVLAIATTGSVPPDPVHRIGARIADHGTKDAPKAFAKDPVARSAAILNASTSEQREALLAAFEEQDAAFAKQVRKAIFTFADIPTRIAVADVPKFIRDVPPEAMVTALVAAQDQMQEVVDFILDNMSKRMADGLRDEMVELGEVAAKPGEAAMGQVTSVIRALADEGTITLIVEEEDEG